MSKLFILLFAIFSLIVFNKQMVGQQSYKFNKLSLQKLKTIYPRQINNDWLFELQNLNENFEGNEGYREFLKHQKELVWKKYNSKDFVRTDSQVYYYYTVDTPSVNGNFISNIYQGEAGKGRNLLSFSTVPLSSGIYLLVIKNDKSILKTHKISIL